LGGGWGTGAPEDKQARVERDEGPEGGRCLQLDEQEVEEVDQGVHPQDTNKLELLANRAAYRLAEVGGKLGMGPV
jgi:hypothetical protein